jgi:branched-chain amino acid transport system permease protein
MTPAAAASATASTGPSPAARVALLVLAFAALAFPFAMQAIDETFYISMASRMLIYGLAAVSLNLVLGYGGLVSFGHAAFVGIGATAPQPVVASAAISPCCAVPASPVASAISASTAASTPARAAATWAISPTPSSAASAPST